MTKDAPSTPFNLPSENTGFSSRSKDIFAGLDSLEKKHDEKQKDLEDNPSARHEQRKLWKDEPEVEAFVAGSSPFKRPSNPNRGGPYRGGNKRFRKPFHKNSTPDYVQHPDKWKRYSLEDCDTSESSNSRAAFKFLDERRKLREAEENQNNDDDEDSGGKMVFKKPTKTADNKSSKAVSAKKGKQDGISIGHLDNDSSSFEETSAETSAVNDLKPKVSESLASGQISFKKSNRKRNLRVREDDD